MATTKKDTPPIKLSQKFMLSISSTAITLLIIDIILLLLFNKDILNFELSKQPTRTEGLYVYNQDLGWKLRPLFKEIFKWDHEYTLEKINEDGWRDYLYSIKKPNDVFRIAVIGCSRTYGYGIQMEDSYPKVLERLLNKRINKKFEVMNFGVNGYGLSQMTLNYSKYVRKYDPDLVVLQIYAPSILRTYYTKLWKANKPTFKIIDGKLTLINHPAPNNKIGSIKSFFLDTSPLFKFINDRLLKMDDNKRTKIKEHLSKFTELHTLNTYILEHLKDNIEKDGKKLVVFIWGENNEWLKQIVENANVEVFTLEDHADIDEWKEKGALENDPPTGHWSPLGNQYVAEAIFNYLKSDKTLLFK